MLTSHAYLDKHFIQMLSANTVQIYTYTRKIVSNFQE